MATDFIITDIYKEEPGLDTQKIDDKLLMQFFETMVTIRLFEEECRRQADL